MRRVPAVLLFAALLAALTGSRSTLAANPGEVVIGACLPLSGVLAPTGARLRQGLELAQELVNGGLNVRYPLPMTGTHGFPALGGAKLRIAFADSQGSPAQGKTIVDDLVSREHAVALIGCYASNVTATASQEAERLGIPFLTPDSTNPTLTQRGFKTFFRTTPDDADFAKTLFDFMSDMKKRHPQVRFNKLALVHEDTLFGKGGADAENALAKQQNYDVAADIAYPNGTSEVQSEVQRIKASGAEVYIMSSYLSDALLFMKTFKEQGLHPLAILAQDAGFVEPALIKTLGKDADGIVSREVWSLHLKLANKGAPLVNDLFRARYGTNMDGSVARNFIGLLVLADAIERAKSTKPDALLAALRATNIPGDRTIMPWTSIRFNQQGQNVGAGGIIVQIQDGEFYTVWPERYAVRPPVWPLPR